MSAFSNGFLREADDSLTVVTSTAGARWVEGFLRGPNGELVVTTTTTNAFMWNGFLRLPTGELVVTTGPASPIMRDGLMRDGTNLALAVSSSGAVAGRKRGFTLDANGYLVMTGLSFTPTNLSTLLAWYDASALGVDGASITNLADSGPGGRTMVSQGGTQPVFHTAQQNGLGALLFTAASSQWMKATIPNTNQPIIVYAVIKATGGSRFFGGGAGALRAGGGGTVQFYAGTAQTGSAMSAGFHQVTYVFNGLSSLARVDAVQNVAGDSGAGAPGTSIALASEGDAAQFFDGYIAELFVDASASLSTSAEAYLKARWATP